MAPPVLGLNMDGLKFKSPKFKLLRKSDAS
jgi:hypothetical protein